MKKYLKPEQFDEDDNIIEEDGNMPEDTLDIDPESDYEGLIGDCYRSANGDVWHLDRMHDDED